MPARLYNPNPYYYDSEGGIQYEFWRTPNKKLAEFGQRNHLPCAGHWIIGRDFAFEIDYAANTYYMATIREFGPRTTEKWHEMRMHLCEVERNWHTLKTRDEVARDLGIMTDSREGD